MPVIDVEKDLGHHTLTVTAELAAPVERVWQIWADPRQLEQWWGPPTYPATVEEHDLVPGGKVTYYMTSPEGERYHGWWRVRVVEPPHLLEIEDGFGNADGTPADDMPVAIMQVTLAEAQGRTLMTMVASYESAEELEKVLAMGMEEGLRGAIGQVDALVA